MRDAFDLAKELRKIDTPATNQAADMLLAADRCAGKIAVSYMRGEISPRYEYEEMMRAFGVNWRNR